MITCCADVLAVSNLFVQGSSAVVKPALTVASIDWTDQDILSVWWVSRVWHPHQHIIGHCGDESLQSVTCAGTDTGTSQNHRETEHKTEQNNSTHSLKWQRWTGQNTPRRTWDKTEPGLVRIYDTKPGNGSGLFCQPWNRHWVNHCDWSMCVWTPKNAARPESLRNSRMAGIWSHILSVSRPTPSRYSTVCLNINKWQDLHV